MIVFHVPNLNSIANGIINLEYVIKIRKNNNRFKLTKNNNLSTGMIISASVLLIL
jgi:hypothetical protein